MLPVLPIRVIIPATPEQKLESAKLYLSAYGSVTLADDADTKTLLYERMGRIDPTAPLFEDGNISISYVPRTKSWECISSMFGINVKMQDPKLFTYNILSMLEDRIGAKQQFLSRVQKYWEQYAGDPIQFLHRLGANLVNQGNMTVITDEPSGLFGHWANLLDTKFDVWFSVKAGPIQPEYSYGFYPEVATHVNSLKPHDLQLMIAHLHRQRETAAEFMRPLIGIF